jgi:hypothetical protein
MLIAWAGAHLIAPVVDCVKHGKFELKGYDLYKETQKNTPI